MISKCVKCGQMCITGFPVEFHRGSGDCEKGGFGIGRVNEHLHYRCSNCSYDWAEDCEDKNEEELKKGGK